MVLSSGATQGSSGVRENRGHVLVFYMVVYKLWYRNDRLFNLILIFSLSFLPKPYAAIRTELTSLDESACSDLLANSLPYLRQQELLGYFLPQFTNWRGSIASVGWDPEQLRRAWERELARSLEESREILRTNWPATPLGRGSVLSNDEPDMFFLGDRYRVKGLLGSSQEADVYWVESGDTESVLKVFFPQSRFGLDTFLRNKTALQILRERGANVVEIQDWSASERTLKLSFKRGYVGKDIRVLHRTGKLSDLHVIAFFYFSNKMRMVLQHRFSRCIDSEIAPCWFNPMDENLLYDPWMGRWVVIDPL